MRRPLRLLAVLAGVVLACALLPGPQTVVSPVTGERIIGGQQAAPGQFPFIADMNTCTGFAITQYVVVTVAACIPTSGPITGTIYIGGINKREGQAEPLVWSIANPEGIAQGNWTLVEVRDPILGTPVKIVDQGDTSMHSGTLTAAGFGTTPPLMYTGMPYVPAATCRTQIPDLNAVLEVCSGVATGTPGPCQGDPGGPLLAKSPAGTWVAIGVLSRNVGCRSYSASSDLSAMSTKIKSYLTADGRLRR
ncbi:hypothetical protein D5S17_09545 [Pseudonocardiaceae bacterium YIM PH 21723]|nr:hypothetical protein D5S17_09545 [Pseudonocardiaceae bacterium YIM PH 21723]